MQISGSCYTAFYKQEVELPRCIGSTLWNLDLNNPKGIGNILETMTIIQRSNISYVTSNRKKNNLIGTCRRLTSAYSRLYLLEPLKWVEDVKPCTDVSGIYLCSSPGKLIDTEARLKESSNLFLCDDGTYILSTFLCDDSVHCVNGTDEQYYADSSTDTVFMASPIIVNLAMKQNNFLIVVVCYGMIKQVCSGHTTRKLSILNNFGNLMTKPMSALFMAKGI